MSIYVIIIIASLILSAFFSGMEIAYVSSNKIHIEIEKKQDGILAKALTKITTKPSKFITTMLIGNNIALVIYGFLWVIFWLIGFNRCYQHLTLF